MLQLRQLVKVRVFAMGAVVALGGRRKHHHCYMPQSTVDYFQSGTAAAVSVAWLHGTLGGIPGNQKGDGGGDVSHDVAGCWGDAFS